LIGFTGGWQVFFAQHLITSLNLHEHRFCENIIFLLIRFIAYYFEWHIDAAKRDYIYLRVLYLFSLKIFLPAPGLNGMRGGMKQVDAFASFARHFQGSW